MLVLSVVNTRPEAIPIRKGKKKLAGAVPVKQVQWVRGVHDLWSVASHIPTHFGANNQFAPLCSALGGYQSRGSWVGLFVTYIEVSITYK